MIRLRDNWVYYNDNDPSAAEWIHYLMVLGQIPAGVVDDRSILDVEPSDLAGYAQCHFFAGIAGWSLALRIAGLADAPGVWTGSPPCQPFSVAGEGGGRDDERHLAPKFTSLVGSVRPRLLFGEQVASAAVFGKVSGPRQRSGAVAPEWAWFDDLSDRLEAAHYAVGSLDIPSAGVGAPHIRQRTFFGAYDLRSAAGWLADAERKQRQERLSGPRQGDREEGSGQTIKSARLCGTGRMEHNESDGRVERGSESEGRGVVGGCGTGGMGHTGGARGEARIPEPQEREEGNPEVPDNGMCGLSGPNPGRPGIGGLADGNSSGPLQRRKYDEKKTGRAQEAGSIDGSVVSRRPGTGGMADAGQQRRQQDARSAFGDETAHGRTGRDGLEPYNDHVSASDGEIHGPSTIDDPWRIADWLFCRDGKWRPVEPGTFPLAHGLPDRVGLLRGYGNAINPWAAAKAIEIFTEAMRG